MYVVMCVYKILISQAMQPRRIEKITVSRHIEFAIRSNSGLNKLLEYVIILLGDLYQSIHQNLLPIKGKSLPFLGEGLTLFLAK